MHHCFAPVTRSDTRLLVLGSLPGARLAGAAALLRPPAEPILAADRRGRSSGTSSPLGYEARLAALLDAGVGLWDTVAAATRKGSLDADIRLHQASDLAALVETLPELRAVAFNGGTSARIGRKQVQGVAGLALVDLPSSSPAYASLPFERKREAWLALRAYL